MSKEEKEERKKMVENIAEEFIKMDEPNKTYIIGYMAGVQEERAKWQKKEKEAMTV